MGEQAVTGVLKYEAATPPIIAAAAAAAADEDGAEDPHDFVSDSLKDILSQQESELSNVLSSISALTSTPTRIAQNCEDEMMGEVDYDVDLVKSTQAKGDGVTGGYVGDGSPGGDVGMAKMSGLSAVKKRLLVTASSAIQNSEKQRQELEEEAPREPGGLSVEWGSLPKSPTAEDRRSSTSAGEEAKMPVVSNDATALSVEEFAGLPLRPCAEFSPRRDEGEHGPAPSPSLMPTMAASPSFNDFPVYQSPIDSPSLSIKKSGSVVDGPPEEGDVQEKSPPNMANGQARGQEEVVGKDPVGVHNKDDSDDDEFVPDSIQKLFRDAESLLQDVLSSPVGSTSEKSESLKDTFCDDYIKPPSSSPSSFSPSSRMDCVVGHDAAGAGWVEEERLADQADKRAKDEKLAVADAKRAEEERPTVPHVEKERLAALQAEEQRLVVEEAQQAEEERLAAKRHAVEEKLVGEAAEREQAEQRHATRRADCEQMVAVQRKQKEMGVEAQEGKLAAEVAEWARAEPHNEEDDGLLKKASDETERAWRKERPAMGDAGQAESERLERQHIEEEAARLLNEAREEAEREEKERLGVKEVRQAEFERLERQHITDESAEIARNEKEAEARLLKQARVEVERAENQRLAVEDAEQAKLELLEMEGIKHKWTLAAQLQKDEEAPLSKETASEVERAENKKLATEVVEESELVRLETERIEHRRALAADCQKGEEACLSKEAAHQASRVEMENLATEAAKRDELERLAGSVNHLSLAVNRNESAMEDDVNILDKAESCMDKIGGIVASDIEGREPPGLKMPLKLVAIENDDFAASDPFIRNENVCLKQNLKPSTGSNSIGVSDESATNESTFMPNISIDVLNSSEVKQAPHTSEESLLPILEDGSGSNGDYDEALLPDRDLTIKSKGSKGSKQISTLKKGRKSRESLGHAPSRSRTSLMPEKEHKARAGLGHSSSISASNSASARDKQKRKASASAWTTATSLRPVVSKATNPLGRSTSGGSFSSQPLSRHHRAVKSQSSTAPTMATSKPESKHRPLSSSRLVDGRKKLTSSARLELKPPSLSEGKTHRVSAATLKRLNRMSSTASSIIPRRASHKVAPLLSQPAKKGSKPSSDKDKPPADVSLNMATENNAVAESITNPLGQNAEATKPLPRNKKTARQKMSSESGKSPAIVIRGKENSKMDAIAKRKPKAKESLVSTTSSRLRSQSNSQAPRQGKQTKKKVDMARLERLARPRPQCMARPRDSDPVKTLQKKAASMSPSKPPSLLFRTAPARTAKSTAELEAQEMESIKPFRARRIRGSLVEVKSRFKTPSPRPPTQGAPSSSVATEPNPKPSSSKPPNNPSSIPQEPGLYKPTPPRERVQTFGESFQHYLKYGLRDILPTTSSKKELDSTLKPSSFIHRRTLSHSGMDNPSEECKKHLQARAVTYASVGPIHRAATRLTRRAVGPRAPLSSEEMELEECRKQFRARPLPVPRPARVPEEGQQMEAQTSLTMSSPFKL